MNNDYEMALKVMGEYRKTQAPPQVREGGGGAVGLIVCTCHVPVGSGVGE